MSAVAARQAYRNDDFNQTGASVGLRAQKRTKTKPRFGFGLVIVVLLAWAGVGYASGLIRFIALRGEMAQVRKQTAQVEQRNRELERTIVDMQSPAYVEKVAREELGLVRPAEVKFVVARPVNPSDPTHGDVTHRANTRTQAD
jgi:cell division protein FtsB